MTMFGQDRWVTLAVDVPCRSCGTTLPAGSRVRRTRGLMRHNGMWIGECCG